MLTPFRSTYPWIFAPLLLSACGAPQSHNEDEKLYSDARAAGIIAPANADEDQILSEMETLKPGQSHEVGGHTVSVNVGYQAASGRECRVVTIDPDAVNSTRRLVCRINDAWSYAPEVFPAPTQVPQ